MSMPATPFSAVPRRVEPRAIIVGVLFAAITGLAIGYLPRGARGG